MTNQETHERETAQMLADHSDGLTTDEVLRLAKHNQRDDQTLSEALHELVKLRFPRG